MEMVNLNAVASARPELIGRKNKKKLRKKEKFFNFLNSIKNIFSGVGSLYIILALICYILISQIKLNNAITNMQRDTHIPRYVIDKVVDYLN